MLPCLPHSPALPPEALPPKESSLPSLSTSLRIPTTTLLACPAPVPHATTHPQAVVPRTTKVNRMEANLDLFSFDLTDADMQRLDALDGSLQLQEAAA